MDMCVYITLFLFFFFKQKTAYELRISDWSSDVCSSDLLLDDAERLQFGLVADQPAVEGDARVQFRAVGGVEPHHSPAPAKAGDTEIGRASCRERVCQYV